MSLEKTILDGVINARHRTDMTKNTGHSDLPARRIDNSRFYLTFLSIGEFWTSLDRSFGAFWNFTYKFGVDDLLCRFSES